MTEQVEVAVVGAGQAGLAISHELTEAGVEHLVLERGRVGNAWRGRWQSFCLVTPNWTVQLPGGHYDGDKPDGFMPRDDIVAHLERYSTGFGAPIRDGVDVTALERHDRGLMLRSPSGDFVARRVVVASGGYPAPHRPPAAAQLPAWVPTLDADKYTKPDDLPAGPILIVGSGQTGCQLADELAEAGREVLLACGRAPWAPRRLGERDTVAWVCETPFLEGTLADLPSPAARLIANVQLSGRDGGRDLNYRTLQRQGVRLLGHFAGVDDQFAHFAPDLSESVAFGDARYADLCGLIATTCAQRGIAAPDMPPPQPFVDDAVERVALADIAAVLFTTGFRPNYTRWIRFPEAFDAMGYPIQVDGSSTVVDGLHFMGVHFQRKRKSATFLGVAEDATVLAAAITAGRRSG